MRRHRFLKVTDTRPGKRDTDETGNARIDVNDRPAGKIERWNFFYHKCIDEADIE